MLPPYRAERFGLLARHSNTAIEIALVSPDSIHHHGELRATATLARRMPMRVADALAQQRKLLSATLRVRMALAD